ncbi:hypothetical protein Asulf_01138 [Archaeoglobus sulfaticallidus PM70-1]|uniref:Phytoene dehydrogenase-related protein n=1 Tax=Archaeoglobus sulfaticallidus PM70-1 TaxID=387631 RepID=N0BDQ8_9EURY|nr:NAD(P)-binding protein [Archaeoglobus sulfaticallidus]AGK61138.1 hypothetical protein Asulf_01138 [Archaeoglobus sulfaticallidus PM70-1]
MRVAIIGAGLGGLLSASILSEKGYAVDVYEKLGFYGGRFTSIKYRGFEISTGALHMIPHGRRGPLGKMLKRIGTDVEIVDSKPEGVALQNGEMIEIRSSSFPRKTKLKYFKWLIGYKIFGIDRTMDEYAREMDDFTLKFFEKFLGWSLSIYPDQIKFSDIYEIYKRVLKYGGPGIPIGGCKKVVTELAEIIKSNDGNIYLKKPVEKLIYENKEIRSLKVDGEEKHYDIFISNIGHSLTRELLGFSRQDVVESRGIKYSIALKEPFIGHTGICFPFDVEKISGMNEVTNADPSLAENGHLLMAHQPVRHPAQIKDEIKAGIAELKEVLKGHEYEIIAIQSYHNDWPVNRVMSGKDTGYQTEFRNLFVVGDGAKGKDIEVDGVALGVANLMREEFGLNMGIE